MKESSRGPQQDEKAPRPLVRLEKIRKVYSVGGRLRLFGRVHQSVVAVDDVDLTVGKAEIVGLVGESGCGKSTLGRLAIRLVEPTSGKIFFDDQDILKLHHGQLRALRRQMQIVFQDPLASLNPRMMVRDILAEPLRVHHLTRSGAELTERAVDLLEQVGLGREHLYRYPHEFSGGQRQRICIARAIAPQPSFIVADEPLSALDVSVQAQIINLLLSLQEELGLAFLFISHDLNVVGVLASRLAVMYLGRIVELGSTAAVYAEPLHPYSKALLAVIPKPDPSRRGQPKPLLHGELPSATSPPKGCSFHPRCPVKVPLCRTVPPELVEVEPGRLVSCHVVQKSVRS